MTLTLDTLKSTIKSIPNYPKEGIIFRDVTSLLENPEAFHLVVREFVKFYRDKEITKVIGTEARGFIFAAPVALELNLPLVLVRKPHKLPRQVIREKYTLEYGTDEFEMHIDAITQGDKVLLVDDLLATGGTTLACKNLVTRCGGDLIYAAFVIDLPGLGGAEELIKSGIQSYSLVSFSGK